MFSFYKSLYKYSYNRIKKRDSDPEIVIIGFISFCQSNNISTIFNLLIYYFHLNINVPLKWFYLSVYFIFYGLNYYYFEVKGIKNNILGNNESYLKHAGLWAILYLIISVGFFIFSFVLLTGNNIIEVKF